VTIEQLREMHQARPFRPFALQMADGEKINVPHPECLAYSRSGRTVSVSTDGDAFKIIDLFLVAALDVNSKHRRGRDRR